MEMNEEVEKHLLNAIGPEKLDQMHKAADSILAGQRIMSESLKQALSNPDAVYDGNGICGQFKRHMIVMMLKNHEKWRLKV